MSLRSGGAILLVLASLQCVACTRYEWACDFTATWGGATTTAPASVWTQTFSPTTDNLKDPRTRADACRYLCSARAVANGKTGYETFGGAALDACNQDCQANAGKISMQCVRGKEAPSSFGAWN